MLQQTRLFRTDAVFGGVIVIGLLGYLFAQIFNLADKYVVSQVM